MVFPKASPDPSDDHGILKNSVHLQIRCSNILGKLAKGPEGNENCAASIGGIFLPICPGLAFRKAQRGPEKKNFGGTRGNPRHNLKGTSAL